MGRERWFRGDRGGRDRPLDWYSLAKEYGIPEKQARELYEEAIRRARQQYREPQRYTEAVYIELLEEARLAAYRPSPGKITRTMLLQAERAGKKPRKSHLSRLTGQPIAPGKRTLTSYLEPAASPRQRAQSATNASREQERLAFVTESLRNLSLRTTAGPEHESSREPQATNLARAAVEEPTATVMSQAAAQSRSTQWQMGHARPVVAAATVALDRKPGAADPARRAANLEHALVEHALAGVDGSLGEPLPTELAQRMTRLLDHDFAHVRIHTDARAAAAAELLGARAFTVGTHIHFGRGQWGPGSNTFERLLAHELTHVVQHDEGRLPADASGRVRVAAPGDSTEREAEATAAQISQTSSTASAGRSPAAVEQPERTAREEAQPHAGAQPGRTSQRVADEHGGERSPERGNVVSRFLSLSDIVRQFSPELADLIDQGPMALVREALEAGLSTFLSPLTATLDSIGVTIDGFAGSFTEAFGFIQGLFAGDPGCCDAFIDGIDRIRNLATSIADNPVVQTIQAGFGAISGAVEQIAMVVLSPAFDLVKDLLGGALEGITSLASTISGWLQPILDFSRDAWNWAMEQLGIGGDGEGGILSWLTDFASQAWSSIAETLAPIAGPLQTVGGVLLALSPVGPIVALIQYGPELVEAVQWLWQNRNSPDIVKQAHEQMGHTFLPGLLSAADGFGEAIQSAATWLTEQATTLSTGLLELLGALTGVPLLDIVRGAVQVFSEGASRLADWASGALSQAVTELKGGFDKLRELVAPYAEVLCSVGMAIANPAAIPVILAGHAWLALPDCIKAPIIDLLLDAAIAVLEAAPSLAMFGPLWALLKSGVIGFLRGLREQPPEVKEQVSNKLARILSGSSPAFLLGFVKGFLQGVWEGLTDPFVLIWTAIQGLGSVVSWFRGLIGMGPAQTAARAPAEGAASTPQTGGGAAAQEEQGQAGLPTTAELGTRAGQMAGELQPPVEQATTGFMPAVQAIFQGGGSMTLEELIARLREAWGAIEGAVQGAGTDLANRVCQFFMGDEAEGQLGESVGWLAGTIAFEVLLGILTAGAWQPVSAAGRALQAFARILDWTGEALGAAFRLLGRIGNLLLDALRGVGRMLSNAGGAVRVVLDALGQVGTKLMAFADELLARFGRGVASEAGERVAREGAQEAGERVAREGAQELGEEAAEQASERAAREGAQEAGEEAAEQGAEEAGEEAAEEASEQGGKRADDAPDMTEKLRVAAEAKIMSDMLERTGMPAGAIASALARSFQPRYPWILRFEAESRGPFQADIFMIASKVKVDEVRREARAAQADLADTSQHTPVQRLDETTAAYRDRLQQRLEHLNAQTPTSDAHMDEIMAEMSDIERRLHGLDVSNARMTVTNPTDWSNTAKTLRSELREMPSPVNPQTLSTEQLAVLEGRLSRRSEPQAREMLAQVQAELSERRLVQGAHRYPAGTSADAIIGDTLSNQRDRVFVESQQQADEIYRTLDQMAERGGTVRRRPPQDTESRMDLPFRGPERHIGEPGGSHNHYNAEVVLPDGTEINIHIYFPDPRYAP